MKNIFTGDAVLIHPMILPGIAKRVVMISMILRIIQLIAAFSPQNSPVNYVFLDRHYLTTHTFVPIGAKS